jgi:nucleoside 2-deoxyribosyltransferase
MQQVYLAGPITGCDYNGCTDWREAVKAELEATGVYRCISPMRGKEALKDVQCFTPFGYALEKGGCSNQDIYRRDSYDVHRSDVVLVNLVGAKRVSIGTMFELAWAQRAGKFVLVVLEDDANPHNHAFVHQGASMTVKSLEDAVLYLKSVLNA